MGFLEMVAEDFPEAYVEMDFPIVVLFLSEVAFNGLTDVVRSPLLLRL